MKKILIMILAVCMLPILAAADPAHELFIGYIPDAMTFGAPLFEKDDVYLYNAAKNLYRVDAGTVSLFFEFATDKAIRTALVCAKDDSCAADFLCSCTAVISHLGKVDFEAFGNALCQFSMARADLASPAGKIGIDSFTMSSNDQYQYIFLYANNDLTAK